MSMRIRLNRSIEDGMFENCLRRFIKVNKLTFEDIKIRDAIFANKMGQLMGEYPRFLARVEELEFREISFKWPDVQISPFIHDEPENFLTPD